MKYLIASLLIAFCFSAHAQTQEAPSAPKGKEAIYAKDKSGDNVCTYQKGTKLTPKNFHRKQRRRRKALRKSGYYFFGCPSF